MVHDGDLHHPAVHPDDGGSTHPAPLCQLHQLHDHQVPHERLPPLLLLPLHGDDGAGQPHPRSHACQHHHHGRLGCYHSDIGWVISDKGWVVITVIKAGIVISDKGWDCYHGDKGWVVISDKGWDCYHSDKGWVVITVIEAGLLSQ